MDYPPRRRVGVDKCCCCFLLWIVLVPVIGVILLSTVLKVRTPTMVINSVFIEHPSDEGSLLPTYMVAETIASVKNPNYLALHYSHPNITAYYHDQQVGQAYTMKGIAPARGTVRLKAWLNLNATKLLDDQEFVDEFMKGSIEFNTTVLVGGKVEILGVIPHHVDLMFNCRLTIDAITMLLKNHTCSQRMWFWKPRK